MMDLKATVTQCWRVGSEVFDTKEKAEAYLRRTKAQAEVEAMLRKYMGLWQVDIPAMAHVILSAWDQLKTIIEGE